MAKQPNIGAGGISITQEGSEDLFLLDGYGDGAFRAKGRKFEGAIYVNEAGISPLEFSEFSDINENIVDSVLENDVPCELLLIGAGPKMQLLHSSIRQYMMDKNLPFEVMDTGAAARTYNVLLMEGRRVAAILLPVE